MADCYARICEHLREGRPIEWLEIGAYPLTAAIEARPESCYEIEADLVCPIPWHDVRRFEQPGDADGLVDGRRWGVMLCNGTASDDLRAQSRDEVWGAETLLGDLLRRALSGPG